MKLHPRFSIFLVFVLLVTSVLTAGAHAASTAQPYIIVFNDTVDVPAAAQALERAHGLRTGFIYEHALKGMSAVVPAGRLIALQKDPRVKYVVEDMERSISGQEMPTGIKRIFADTNANIDIDGSDDYRVDVDVAVIDTGVDFQHPDLNVAGGVNCTGKIFFAKCVAGGDDDHYHGTHVAGTIGALDNDIGVVGVAPGARIWAVKVLSKNGSGYSSWIIAGIDWVAANAATIEVANMSLGGLGFNQAEYNAIQGAVNKGVAFAVAAGNEDSDARNYSPGGFNNVLSVSALADFDGKPGGLGSATCRADQDDTLADFSNWGPEVDIAAPGVCILSTYPIEQGSYGTISGTSMASPHAAGALALLASKARASNATGVYALYEQVIAAGNDDWTDDSTDGIQEPLLDVTGFAPKLLSTGVTPPPNTAPTAAFTYTTNNLDAAFTDTSSDSDGSIVSWSWNFGDNNTSTAQNPSHTYATGGTYTVSLTVTDDDGATGTTSKSVTVTASSEPSSTITVSSLVGSGSTVNKKFWKANVVVTLDKEVSGAVVSGSFSTGGSVSCTTDTVGKCSVASANISTNTYPTVFTVSGVTLAGYKYEPNLVTVTVPKP